MCLAVGGRALLGRISFMQAGQGCDMHYLGAGWLHLLGYGWVAATEAPILDSGRDQI